MNKYVFMRGYLLHNLKMKHQKLCNKLLKNNDALLFIESDNNYIKLQKDFKDETFLARDFFDDINNLLIGEINYLQNVNSSSIILLHPITIYFEDSQSLNLKIYLRIFKNDIMIVTVETETNLDVGAMFEKRVIYIETTNENYLDVFNKICNSNVLSIFEILPTLLKKYFVLSKPIMRNFFIMDKPKMTLKDITKSLCQSNYDFKAYEPLKDFRNLTDYYHYSNELSSVILGKNLKDAYYRLLMLDHFIIYLMMSDFRTYERIKKNKYNLKKLYEIKEAYDFSYATLKYAKLVEDNDYVCYVLKTQNKNNLSNICTSAIDRKIELKNNRFQNILTILGLFLAIPTLVEFIQDGRINKIIEFIKSLI